MNENDKLDILEDGLETISQSAHFLGVSRSFLYGLINSGDLPTVKIGKSRRVPKRAVRLLALNNLQSNETVLE